MYCLVVYIVYAPISKMNCWYI